MSSCDTIAAIATPSLPSAIGILRLSGPNAIQAAQAVFTPAKGLPLNQRPDRTFVFGTLHDRDGAVIDQALATVSRAPHSYTGEDTAELQCHGSPTVLALGLEALFAAGARQAGPGEFTRRAFLNGKLDLTQAEAVADLIDAETPQAVRNAAGQLSGVLSRRIGVLYDNLVDLLAHFHAVLDYPDEEIDPFRAETIASALSAAQRELENLLTSYRRGRFLVGGIPCAIVGRPNAGKSSLLNALLGYDRAIVTSVPGTTRDTIEERCTLGGVLLRLIDTAGLRKSGDPIEQLGVERSCSAMEAAQLILAVVDRSAPLTQEDRDILAKAQSLAPTILVWSKADLPPASQSDLGYIPSTPAVAVSARTGQGLEALESAVAAYFPQGEAAAGELLTNTRQFEAASRALEALLRAQDALEAGVSPDALLTDVEEALSSLGEITGRVMREEITARIFQRFCVGK